MRLLELRLADTAKEGQPSVLFQELERYIRKLESRFELYLQYRYTGAAKGTERINKLWTGQQEAAT